MADVAFPFEAIYSMSRPRLTRQLRGRGFSISGAETIVPSFRAFWEITVKFIVEGERATLQWDAFIAQMEDGIGTTQVPIFQQYRPRDLRNNFIGGVQPNARLADAQTFEHFGFQNEPVTYAQTTDAAALRAARLGVSYTDTTGLRPGHRFSFYDRLYMVQREWVEGDVTTLEVKPPLRAAVASGTRLNIDYPVCKMRLAGEGAGWEKSTASGIITPELTFREAL